MKLQLKADLSLLFVAVGWGINFIFTKNALAELGAFNFLSIRFVLAFVMCALVFAPRFRKLDRQTLISSTIMGVVLFLCYTFNTLSILYTSIAKSAFITCSSVVIVPIFLFFLLKERPETGTLIGCLLAFVGLGCMTLTGYEPMNIGDFLALMAALCGAVHLILTGKYTKSCDSVLLGIVQLGVVGLLSTAATLMFEKPIIPPPSPLWVNLALISLICTAGAFIILTVAQQYTSASHAALILTAEPVFAAIFAFILLGDRMTALEVVGAILATVGILASEVDFKSFMRFKKPDERAENATK